MKKKIIIAILGIVFIFSFWYWFEKADDFAFGTEEAGSVYSVIYSSFHLDEFDGIYELPPKPIEIFYSWTIMIASIVWGGMLVASLFIKKSLYQIIFTAYTWAFSTSFVAKLRLDTIRYGIADLNFHLDFWARDIKYSNCYTFYIAWACLIAIGIINLVYLRKESKKLSTRIV